MPSHTLVLSVLLPLLLPSLVLGIPRKAHAPHHHKKLVPSRHPRGKSREAYPGAFDPSLFRAPVPSSLSSPHGDSPFDLPALQQLSDETPGLPPASTWTTLLASLGPLDPSSGVSSDPAEPADTDTQATASADTDTDTHASSGSPPRPHRRPHTAKATATASASATASTYTDTGAAGGASGASGSSASTWPSASHAGASANAGASYGFPWDLPAPTATATYTGFPWDQPTETDGATQNGPYLHVGGQVAPQAGVDTFVHLRSPPDTPSPPTSTYGSLSTSDPRLIREAQQLQQLRDDVTEQKMLATKLDDWMASASAAVSAIHQRVDVVKEKQKEVKERITALQSQQGQLEGQTKADVLKQELSDAMRKLTELDRLEDHTSLTNQYLQTNKAHLTDRLKELSGMLQKLNAADGDPVLKDVDELLSHMSSYSEGMKYEFGPSTFTPELVGSYKGDDHPWRALPS